MCYIYKRQILSNNILLIKTFWKHEEMFLVFSALLTLVVSGICLLSSPHTKRAPCFTAERIP